ncbi:uncharacterized protein BDR25DRAFT_79562 [Lindgomyces ingoldianus]|uniref:Uncharacterized protein n=1 Tax=Lindgomyces ingoldianus TaxID=673940 RepID=A0ACB6QGV5_9PLEO|nr:uncharacterized protein BDR25DRAFT_79562 [Lindgomyces ingoldianus]KAF2466112.1 hypothetical protein BDR25DRAFT_79562 [Lindgomyces ingoldianus]
MGSRRRLPGKYIPYQSIKDGSQAPPVNRIETESPMTTFNAGMNSITEPEGHTQPTTEARTNLLMPQVDQTIHFTVRIMMAENIGGCVALKAYRTSLVDELSSKVAWKLDPAKFQTKRRLLDAVPYIEEDHVTDKELDILRRWIQESGNIGGTFQQVHTKRFSVRPFSSGVSQNAQLSATMEASYTKSFQVPEKSKSFADRLNPLLDEARSPKLMYQPKI